MRKAVDVSSYQGKIDWRAVKAAGISHAVIRSITKNGKPDYYFEKNVRGCEVVGMPYSIYKYSYALTVATSKLEAERVVALLEQTGCPKSTMVWWDMEYSGQRALTRSARMDIIWAARDVIEAAGYPFGVYCNMDWYKNVLDSTALDCPIWLARYPYQKTREMQLAENPPESHKPTFVTQELWAWQYTSSGRVPGISGRVDLNIIYSDVPEAPESDGTDTGGEVTASEINEPVRSLQEALNFDGYRDAAGRRLAEDGIIGANTRAALRKVALKAAGWTGIWYGVGSTGATVMWLQMQLNTVSGSNLTADGKYGHDTRLAVGAWQESHGLTKDYIAGINTILSLVE